MSSTHQHFFQKILSTSLGWIPANKLGSITNSTVDAPLVLAAVAVTKLVDETNLDPIEVQDVEVRKRRGSNPFPVVVNLHGLKTKRVNGGVNGFFEKNHSWLVGTS